MNYHHHHHQMKQSEVFTKVEYNKGEINITLVDNEGNVPDLEISHEKLLHLIIVSDDLQKYMHLHPYSKGDGVYVVKHELRTGSYKVFVDIVPVGKHYVVEPNSLVINDSDIKITKPILTLEEDLTKELQGKKVTLNQVIVNTLEDVDFIFNTHGEEIKPYLGALGHVVIVDENIEEFIHVHPQSNESTTFTGRFTKDGMYKLWVELNYPDVGVLAIPYVIQVNKKDLKG